MPMAAKGSFQAFAFRVTGRVQKVWFRKHTQDQADAFQVRGYVQNNLDGSVSGEIMGQADNVQKMQHWLSKVGSPKSQIESASFEELPGDAAGLFEAADAKFEFRRPHLKQAAQR